MDNQVKKEISHKRNALNNNTSYIQMWQREALMHDTKYTKFSSQNGKSFNNDGNLKKKHFYV